MTHTITTLKGSYTGSLAECLAWQEEHQGAMADIDGVDLGELRVEAGEGEDRDTGRIESIDGDMALVAWDSGVKTPCPLADLRLAGEDE